MSHVALFLQFPLVSPLNLRLPAAVPRCSDITQLILFYIPETFECECLSLSTTGLTQKHKNFMGLFGSIGPSPVLLQSIMSSLSTSFLRYSLLQLWIWVQDRKHISRCHSRPYSVLFNPLFRKSISKATSRPLRLPSHRESFRDEGVADNGSSSRSGIRNTVTSSPILVIQYMNLSLPGDLIYLNAAGQPIVIINSPKVAMALLDRRTAIYSDRPRNIIVSDIMCGGLLFAFSRYGDT